MGCKVAGTDEVLPELYRKGFRNAFVSVGSMGGGIGKRKKLYQQLQKIGFQVPAIVDPSAAIALSAKIGSGVFIGKNSVVNANACIGDMVIINSGALIEHDCRIGEFSHMSVGSVICGGSTLESNVFVGAHGTIIQEVSIGKNCVIGAGSIVLADVPKGERVIGVWKKSQISLSLTVEKSRE